jgi:hypothetical protein
MTYIVGCVSALGFGFFGLVALLRRVTRGLLDRR